MPWCAPCGCSMQVRRRIGHLASQASQVPKALAEPLPLWKRSHQDVSSSSGPVSRGVSATRLIAPHTFRALDLQLPKNRVLRPSLL